MDKGKIKRVIMQNKKKSLIISVALIVMILLMGIIAYATGNEEYVVDVTDNGEQYIAKDDYSSVTKKIILEEPRSMTYELTVNNLKSKNPNTEVAILIDNSNSMTINDIKDNVKPKAIEFIQGLLNEIQGLKVSISTNSEVKTNLGITDINTYTNIINSITTNSIRDLNDGLDNALSTFSNNGKTDRYIVIFSDATDSILEKIQSNSKPVTIYAILTDITNNEYTNNPNIFNEVQMISNTNFSSIYNKMDNSLRNVKITDKFTTETNSYFKFDVITKDDDVTVTKTNNGYELLCDNIKAGETRKLQFKLTIDDKATIDAGKTYRELNTSDKLTVEYDDLANNKQTYDMNVSPKYLICKKYSLTIKAVSEKSNKLAVPNLNVKVVGTTVTGQDSNGKDIVETIYDKMLTTDSNGEIKIDDLKTLGDIKFEIKPMVSQVGYDSTDATTIIVSNDPTGIGGISAKADVGAQPIVDNVKRNIDVTLPIKVKTIEVRVEAIDSNNSNMKLGNIDFRLIQPRLNNKYEMDVLYGTTDAQGKVTFRPTVMPQDGTYEYILSQMSEQDGYDSMGNVTIYITFENGEIKSGTKTFTHKYNTNVETQRINANIGKVTVKNDSENADTFKLQINVTDSNDSTKKLEGAIYDIEVTRVASNGEQVTNTINGCRTDQYGRIELDLPGRGMINVKITEVQPKTGYFADTQDKEILITRKDGIMKKLSQNVLTFNATADSDTNTLIVNLTSQERSAKNRIQVHLIDNVERDVNIPGTPVTLVNVANNKTYQGLTDKNGIVNFLVDDEQEGIAVYDIKLTNGAPYGYTCTSTTLGSISVHFDADKYINSCSDTRATAPYFATRYDLMVEPDYSYHTGIVTIGLTPDEANTYNFQVKLVTNDGDPIEGAKYDIKIIDTDTGTEIRTIEGRMTDEFGMLTTRLLGGNHITIKVKQTETIQGYCITPQEEIIDLVKNNGEYQIVDQQPYMYDPQNGGKIGAEKVNNTIIYHDVNEGKDPSNILLNLYVNKKDKNNALVDNVRTVITSPTLKLEGKAITESTDYTGIAKSGNAFTLNPAVTDNNGYFEVEGIQVNGAELFNGERVDYLYMYEVDVNGNKISNTDITLKLTFRYDTILERVEITNVESTWGNRLIISKTFDNGQSNIAYEANIYADIYTNYEDVGNFTLDLNKVNVNDQKVLGAKYDITVTRPDGSRIIRKDLEITDDVEFEGLFVSQGTRIEITEKEAPLGYALNETTDTLTIGSIDPNTGEIILSVESHYATPRTKIVQNKTIILPDGTFKTFVTLDLIDTELDTFKFGITTKDAQTSDPISGYKFNISSDQGAESKTEATDNEGKTSTLVGANYDTDGYTVTYTVENIKAGDYYKKVSTPIEVKVVFDINGQVKTAETIQANQNTTGYGIIWTIEATNTVEGNDIDILINVEPQEKLIVNVQTEDIFSKTQLTNIEYEITPSKIESKGTTQIEVGYVLANGVQTYTIKETNSLDNYIDISNKDFKITYDENGDISTVNAPEALSNGITIVSYNGKEITIKVDIEPAVPFVIINKAFFGDTPLSNAQFEISIENVVSKTSNTNVNGNTVSYVGEFGTDTEVTYKVKQLQACEGYAKVPEFNVKVTYDADRNITQAVIDGNVNDHVNFVTVTTKVPSQETDLGYNGNNKGIVNIEIKNYPEVQFNITNKDKRDGTTTLFGAVYEVTSKIPTKDKGAMVDETGVAVAHLDRGAFGVTVEYTIKEINPAPRYQTMLSDVIVEVDFDENGYIINAPRIKGTNNDVTVSKPAQNTDADKFRVNVEILSNPKLTINVHKIDEQTNTPLANVDFEITARITKEGLTNLPEEVKNKIILASTEPTEEQYLSQVLDRLKINPDNVQTIKENIAINNIVNELKAKGQLTQEEENQIQLAVNNVDKINRIIDLQKATKTQINKEISSITNKEVVDVLINNNTTTQDRVNELLQTLKDLVRLDVDNITTNSDGNAIAYMDKTLASKTIEYTIKETRKADGYDWQDEPIIIEITYDENGKIISQNPIRVVSGAIDIDGFNVDDFVINTTIKNKPSDEVRIHLTVEDAYDSNKKLETAEFDAYLVDTSKGIGYLPDDKYRVQLSSENATAHGEDIQSMGIYSENKDETRILRLEEKQAPNTYFEGNQHKENKYQSIKYALLASIHFSDEGKVLDAGIYNAGGDTHQIGFIADERYITVSHTNNTINITIKYYPMLQVQMVTKDMYTGDALQGKYRIYTYEYGNYDPFTAVKSGYINPNDRYYNDQHHQYEGNYMRGTNYNINYTTDSSLDTINGDIHTLYGAQKVPLAPTEADNVEGLNVDSRERTYWIYEIEEPTQPIQYQKYREWHTVAMWDRLIGVVKVTYDEYGKIKTTELIKTESTNNIQSGFMEVKADSEDGYTIQITVKYAPITTITATVIDEVTGKGLSGIRIQPYQNNTQVTNNSYEYRTQKYYTTGSNGVTGWTYWGASINGGQVRYELDSYTSGSGYNGYLDPGNIILDVQYDENGRISGVTPISKDSFGDTNAINISWQDNDIKITIPYSRAFNVKLNKQDYNDKNTKLNAVFNVTSSEDAKVTLPANSKTTIGKVYPGKTVKYTLSEQVVPKGYIPISNLEIEVTFNADGTIASATSTSDYYEFVRSAPADNDVNRINKIDLEANIKNKPRFDISLDLSDKFYPTLKLEGGIFEMTNSKKDTMQGAVVTDKNGVLETYLGEIYPGEEIEYTIKQKNTISGYYPNTETIRFSVKFTESGKIESYTLLNGNTVATIDPNKYVNTRGIHLSITNEPKDIRVGISKYDKLTNKEIPGVTFNVKTEVINENTSNTELITNANGSVIDVADNFVKRTDNRIVKYTISEIQVPNTYRKIQDIVIQITYNEDGSMYLYEVLSNESGVEIEVASNTIKYVDDVPVHIKLTIPNDNAYDLIIKNEDTDYAGLGIEGTQYDVSVNGNVLNPVTTNSKGIASLLNRTEAGDITIRIAEREIGEGYRADNNNDTTITLHKGETEYSLALTNNSNPTYATVEVDDIHGTVTVTFKNETKLELNLLKNDINTGDVLEGAVFEITSKEIDEHKNEIPNTLTTITTTDNNTTDENGLIYFDLGKAPQNKTIVYTLTEQTAPTGYTEILPINVKVKFDAYGRIINIEDDSFRGESYLGSSTGKSHNMTFVVSNGTVDPQYTVKVVSEDSQRGTRINGSIFQVEVFDSTGESHKSVTGTTRSISKTLGNKTVVAEKGVMKVNGIKAEGNIKIAINQVETATGYVYGSNQVSGNVLANAEFIVSAGKLDKDLVLSKVPNGDGGFEVIIDNTNREIIIKVKNDPQLTFDITKIDGETKQKLSNVEFTVTSEIQTTTKLEPTDLNNTAKLTDEKGHTTLNGGIIPAGRTIIYTLRENKLAGYRQLDDIRILVEYDTNGNIIHDEILSDVNDVRIVGQGQDDAGEAMITEVKRTLGASDVPGIVEVDYYEREIPTGIGTKILQLEISNKKEQENPNIFDGYKIVIEKHLGMEKEDYPDLIAGVTFEIRVRQEYGKAETVWTDITNEDGIITSDYFDGYGNITIDIKEIKAPDGFKIDSRTKTIVFERDKDTHILKQITSDVNWDTSEDKTSTIYLAPVNQLDAGIHSLVVNKVDKKDNTLIANNPATIEIHRIEEYSTVTPVEDETTGDITYDVTTQEVRECVISEDTDENGRITKSTLKMPQEPGTYKYVISETNAPEGYIGLKEDAQMEVTFAHKEGTDEMIITNAVVTKGADDVKVLKVLDQFLSIVVENTNENVQCILDVTKVDNEQNAITTDTAIFKLTDMQTDETSFYETNEDGKLEISKIPTPTTEGTYIYKLNEVKAPNGYKLDVNDIIVKLQFAKDSEGKIYLSGVEVNGSNVVYDKAEEGKLPNTTISMKVINEEGSIGTGNTNDKRYTFVLNKVDKQTKEPITQNVEFEVILANGETVKGKTNDEGKLIIQDVFMPAKPGEYEFVIKEITTPDGYKVDNEKKVVKVTFTGYADEMIITNIVLDDTYNTNIEILNDKCTQDYIELNILNEKDDAKLYVVSKLNEENTAIYDVLENYQEEGKHYTIDEPFIDTKVTKYGRNITVQEFIDNLESNGHMVVLDADGNELAPTDIVSTGMTLKSTLNNEELTFKIVIKGDADGDERVRTKDLEQLIDHLKGEKITDPIKLRALDLDSDGRIRTTDMNKFYDAIAGI